MQKSIEERAAEIMYLSGLKSESGRKQFEHRLKLIDFWNIYCGTKILEIGCGQGETTSALAYTVGENGFVYGVDVAGLEYGAPETVGDARARLMSSHFGDRINMDYGVNILSDKFDFEPNSFNYIVLSHCLWYMSSHEELRNILLKIRPWAPRLCIAEWNPQITDFSQYPHFLSANIQALCECYHISDHYNIKTMFYPHDIEFALSASGWDITSSGNISVPEAEDAFWEIDITKDIFPQKISSVKNMPQKLKQLLLSQIYSLGNPETASPMDVFALTAERIG